MVLEIPRKGNAGQLLIACSAAGSQDLAHYLMSSYGIVLSISPFRETSCTSSIVNVQIRLCGRALARELSPVELLAIFHALAVSRGLEVGW